MIELSLLGLHALRGPDGRELTSLPAQPKRFALLAYLALGGSGGYHRRDSLVAVFWPELDQFAARRALRNTLYHLREALGDQAIVTRGDEAVAINPAMLTCDVTRLGDAFATGRYEEVVDGFRGELLAGVHFADSGEAYEEWLSRERARITTMVMQAVTLLVDREEAAGNLAAATHWAQRACALDPRDEVRLRRAMTLLQQHGDNGSALHLYDTCASRLYAEFKARPSADTTALAAALRVGGGRAPEALVRVPHLDLPSAESEDARNAVLETPPARAPARARPRRIVKGLVAVGAVVVIGIVVRAKSAGSTKEVDAHKRVLVAVFDNRTGDTALQSLGRMTQDWLAQGILRTNLVDVVDPRAVFVQEHPATGAAADPVTMAHRTGAALVVSGSYYRTGDTLVFQAAVMDVRTGRVVRALGPILSSVRAPLAGLDELRSRVMAALALLVDVRATQNIDGGGAVPTFDAYQAYVDGWDAFWHGDGRASKVLFLQAAHRDSTFAKAGLAAAMAAANSNDCALVDSLAHALGGGSQLLDKVDRLSLRIDDARCRGRNEEMLRLTLERADLEPGNAGDQMSAAAAASWAHRPTRTIELLQRINPAVDLAWNTDTTHFTYWSGLAEAYHQLGRYREELAAAERVPPGAPLSRIWLQGTALAALSRPTAALALIDSSLTLPVETVSDIGLAPLTDGRPQYTVTPAWVANWISRELAVHGDTVASRQAAARAMAWYRGRTPEERASFEERLVAAWSLEMLGEFAEAETLVRQLVAEDSTNVDFKGELAGLAAERGDTALADSLDRWLAAQPVVRVAWTASVYRARVAALLGKPGRRGRPPPRSDG